MAQPISIGGCGWFGIPDHFCWGAQVAKEGDTYHMVVVMWPSSAGMAGWKTAAKFGRATAPSPFGPWAYEGVMIEASHSGRASIFNPALVEHEGLYYLFFSGADANGKYDIGLYVAGSMAGPWAPMKAPVFEQGSDSYDANGPSNPSVLNGAVWCMMIKYGAGPTGPRTLSATWAPHPLGPWQKPRYVSINNVDMEDPALFTVGGKHYALIRDIGGDVGPAGSIVLYQSSDLIAWTPHADPVVFANKTLAWAGGSTETLERYERPGIYSENGVPRALYMACKRPNVDSSFIAYHPITVA